MAKILFLYNSSQTYTDTVFQHIASFGKYSRHTIHYTHHDPSSLLEVDLSPYDAVCIHYSIRLPFDQVSTSGVAALQRFEKLKVLFIQDEYDHTQRAWHWIRKLGIKLVFTVVPRESVNEVYPADQLPDTRFCSVLTGYVPDRIDFEAAIRPPSQRKLLVGYRGRPLPVRYGRLGFEKVEIGQMVKDYCESHGFACDIAWTEKARIYGTKWLKFVASCRAMLGSESGSNVFDFDGSLTNRLREFRDKYPLKTDDEVYHEVIRPEEREGLMNQISPRAFEAISLRTVLVLFEGHYSGVLKPETHYIALKKDGSNLSEVFSRILDRSYVDAIADRAFNDVVGSRQYSYETFVATVDNEIEDLLGACGAVALSDTNDPTRSGVITLSPVRAVQLSILHKWRILIYHWTSVLTCRVWWSLPLPVRGVVKFMFKTTDN